METRYEITRLERAAEFSKRELIVVIDRSLPAGEFRALGLLSSEFAQLSQDELEALRASHDALLVVSVETPG